METPVVARPRTAWYSSLYWRIAIGFIVLIALVLAAQGAVFLWLLDRSTPQFDSVLTRALSAELSSRLAAEPDLNLDQFVRTVRPGQHVFVIMADGRVRGSRTPPESTLRAVFADFKRGGPVPATYEGSVYRAVPIVVDGREIGVIGIVPPTTLEVFGVEMAAIGAGLLLTGTVLASLLIVGPVRRRIHDLMRAAGRVGAGDLDARAGEDGGDELAEFARAFNRMAAQLAASDRARRQLVADVSHELMTPLTAVLGHLETLMMTDVHIDEARRMKYLGITRREAQRLERLIGDLLDMAKLEAGGVDLEAQPLSVTELFDRIAAHHEYECVTRRIELARTIAPGAETVVGDPFRLEQALANVTANAFRHSPDGSRIELAAAPAEGGMVSLSVTDHGEGIAAGHLPMIFDRFYKARPAGSAGGAGSGLGLSIVKAIVVRHGGRVSASSTVGKGTTIRLELPAGTRLPPDEPRATVGPPPLPRAS